MKKIKWEHILLFFLELLVNMATVGVAILLNALIDAAQISITSQDAHHLQKVLFISILYAVCLGVLVFLSNRYKACYIRKRLLEMRTVLADGTLQSSIANYEETGNASYVTAFNQNFSIIEEKVLQNRISILDSVICIVFAVLVLLYMNPPMPDRCSVGTEPCKCCYLHCSHGNPKLIAKSFYQGTWHSTGNSHEINNILQ